MSRGPSQYEVRAADERNGARRPRPTMLIVRPIAAGERGRELAVARWGPRPVVGEEGRRKTLRSASSSARRDAREDPGVPRSFKRQRCLVSSTGSTNGAAPTGTASASHPSRRSKPFAIAGVWDSWTSPEAAARSRSCAVVTTEARQGTSRPPRSDAARHREGRLRRVAERNARRSVEGESGDAGARHDGGLEYVNKRSSRRRTVHRTTHRIEGQLLYGGACPHGAHRSHVQPPVGLHEPELRAASHAARVVNVPSRRIGM